MLLNIAYRGRAGLAGACNSMLCQPGFLIVFTIVLVVGDRSRTFPGATYQPMKLGDSWKDWTLAQPHHMQLNEAAFRSALFCSVSLLFYGTNPSAETARY